MKKFLLFLGVALCATLCVDEASAQIKAGKGQVSISLESNNTYYAKDKHLEDIGLIQPGDRKYGDFGSNDYLKVDYSQGRFSVGVQVDGYLPGLYGYDLYKYAQRDSKFNAFLSKYVQWEDRNWGVRVGDIYEQFGNGLIFRTYEDRNLGFNNSLAGARINYNFKEYFAIKAVAGLPRLYDVRSKNWVWGADLSLSISDMAGWQDGMVSVEGSYVGRYDNNLPKMDVAMTGLDTRLLNMVSGRLNFEYAGFSLRGEYAAKLNDDLYNPSRHVGKGNVINVDLGYNYKRFSVSATFRRQENMLATIDNLGSGIGGGNVINYLPLLTRQHTYSLANLNPYLGASVHTGGEIGGQIDIYYSLRNPKARGRYWNFHANFSMFNTIKHNEHSTNFETNMIEMGEEIEGRNVWLDFNFDVERQWNKSLKTTLFYSYQRWDEEINHFDSEEADYYDSHIFVADITYKINKKHSLRFEAQYLASDNYEGDWVAATIEYNFAPKFSFYVSDMWNCEAMDGKYGNKKINLTTYEENYELLHYYQVGATFTHDFLRLQLSYGRNRAGYVCSGGSCRFQPAYTGANLVLTLSF